MAGLHTRAFNKNETDELNSVEAAESLLKLLGVQNQVNSKIQFVTWLLPTPFSGVKMDMDN